jgi:hypothetical protein
MSDEIDDPFLTMLAGLASADGELPTYRDVAAGLVRESLRASREARIRGDLWAGRFHSLVAGQALQVSLLCGLDERLQRLEARCPGLVDDE